MTTVNDVKYCLCPKLNLLLRTHVGPNVKMIFLLESLKTAQARVDNHQENLTRVRGLRQTLEATMAATRKDTKTYDALVKRHTKSKERETKALAALTKANKTKANMDAKAWKENYKWNLARSASGEFKLTTLFDPLPPSTAAAGGAGAGAGAAGQEQEEEQEEGEEAAATVGVITRADDEEGIKRAKVEGSSSEAPQQQVVTTIDHLLSTRDIASHLLAFVPSLSALRVGETSKGLHPLVDAAITHVAMKILPQTDVPPPAGTLTIASRFPILFEVGLEYKRSNFWDARTAIKEHFTGCLIDSGLHKRICTLNLHVTWKMALVFNTFLSAPWPLLRVLSISPDLTSFLERLQQTTTSLVNVEVLGCAEKGDLHALANAVRAGTFPRLQCINFSECLYAMTHSLSALATVLTKANHTKTLNLSLGPLSYDLQLLEPLTQAIATGPCFLGMRVLKLSIDTGNHMFDLLFTLGKIGRVPMLEELELWWNNYWRDEEEDEEQHVTKTMDPQAWPCLRRLSFPIGGRLLGRSSFLSTGRLADDRALVTGLLSAPGPYLSTLDLTAGGHGLSNRVEAQTIHLVLELIGGTANGGQHCWGGCLTYLHLPCLQTSGWADSSYVQTTKTALLHLPHLKQLHTGLYTMWWICGVLEAFEGNGLRQLREWHFEWWEPDKRMIDGLLMLVAWLKEESEGLASDLEVTGLVCRSPSVREKIELIGIPALGYEGSFMVD